MVAKPQAPGIVTPQIPTPLRNSQVTPMTTPSATVAAKKKPPHQAHGVEPVSTMPAIFWVTLLKLCPGAMTAYSPVRGSIIGSCTVSGSGTGWWVAILSKLRVRVNNAGRVRGPRTVVQIGEHLVIALRCLSLRNLRVRIIHVAEHDRIRRASLLAGRDDLSIADGAVFLVGLNLGRLNALHAVAALFHHATRTHRDVRIAHELEALGVVVRIQQEVEAAHLVNAVVRAVPRADAAVVHHYVQALRRVDRGAHRAHLLASGRLTVLAQHRLEERLGCMQIALEIRIDANPLHDAADLDLFTADDRDIVLRIAAHDAGIAAHTRVQVNRHSPFVLQLPRGWILVVISPRVRPEAFLVRNRLTLRVVTNLIDQRQARTVMGIIRILLHFGHRGIADN